MGIKQTILIVEDNEDLALGFQRVLTKEGYHVKVAFNGNDGCRMAELIAFDLILLDVVLPDFSGIDLIGHFKRTSAPNAFVVLMSGEAISTGSKALGLDSGADGYISKPIQNRELVALVNAFSRHKRTTDQLIIARERAESSEKMKSFFLANMSHEIRTPLNAIIGFSELLEDDEIRAEDKAKYYSLIRKNGDTLLALISDILDLSNLESGKIRLWKQQFDIREMLEDLKTVYEKRISETKPGKVTIRCNLSQLSDPFAFTDLHRVTQVVSNLVDNAVKFTGEGSVVISANDLTSQTITISIEDSGCGIENDQLEYILQPFGRIELNTGSRVKGTGLGLAIVSKIMQSMQGEFKITSDPGKGSVFTVRFSRELDCSSLADR